MQFEKISITVDEGIARLCFIDGAKGNPMDGQLCAELAEAAIVLSERRGVRCVLLTAQGKAFSYGGDIAAFFAELDALPSNIKRWTTTLHSAIARFQRMDAPIVAAVHGICTGGMAGFIAGSDIVVGSPQARFVAAYAGIGYSCDAGSSVMISRRMGLSRARKYLLLNEILDADAALQAGLLDEIVADADLLGRAEAIAQQLASGPTKAFGEMRRLLLTVEDQPLETQLELEAQALARISRSQDAREGLTAFSQRRAPRFIGA
ncbi:enoyl-CoA hydratase/isomerase family protein [Novosphingobium sp. BL-52-GroH]|uniref:enoyl-CoA hydratase/isomerase family protein n=1 Tax=Novosphingobium sp. BL-52-GroH TaxID=3349877 RepID=UPI00384B9104